MAAAAAAAIALLAVTGTAAQVGPQLGPHDRVTLRSSSNPEPDVWGLQQGLLDGSVARIPARATDRPNIYAVAIAPLARQNLFSREAKAALQDMAANYGGVAASGVLLSNAAGDAADFPLATRQNIEQVLAQIGRRTRASPDDIVMIYLVSHGAPDATLESALPRNLPILPISADSMAAALDQAQIRRRVIVISACFAGSWIPRLANDDSIIITAAAADRTSFGCAEDRPLTYFGDAFLNGPFARGASLHESYEGARKTVTQQEADEKKLNSLPQAYVGKNMQAFWETAAKPQPAAQRTMAAKLPALPKTVAKR